MKYMQIDLYKRMEDDRRAQLRHDAQIWQLLQQCKSRPHRWLVRQRCWLLCQLGRWMVRIGQQLKSVST